MLGVFETPITFKKIEYNDLEKLKSIYVDIEKKINLVNEKTNYVINNHNNIIWDNRLNHLLNDLNNIKDGVKDLIRLINDANALLIKSFSDNATMKKFVKNFKEEGKLIERVFNEFVKSGGLTDHHQVLSELNKLNAHSLTVKSYITSIYEQNLDKNKYNPIEDWQVAKLDLDVYAYYKPILRKSSDDLLQAVIELTIKKMQPLSLNKKVNYHNLWTLFKKPGFKDWERGKEDTILDIYSKNRSGQDQFNFTEKNQQKNQAIKKLGDGYNREHIIPQSHFKKEFPMHSDAHHIFPVDSWTNSRRSNFDHDVVKTQNKFKFANNSKLGLDKNNKTVFEPDDAFKGDVARSYLYFALRYNSVSDKFDSKTVFQKQFPFIKEYRLETLLNWHEKSDPIDMYDLNRNNEIYQFQKNRNPFIDIPYLSKFLWNKSYNDKPLVFGIK